MKFFYRIRGSPVHTSLLTIAATHYIVITYHYYYCYGLLLLPIDLRCGPLVIGDGGRRWWWAIVIGDSEVDDYSVYD